VHKGKKAGKEIKLLAPWSGKKRSKKKSMQREEPEKR